MYTTFEEVKKYSSPFSFSFFSSSLFFSFCNGSLFVFLPIFIFLEWRQQCGSGMAFQRHRRSSGHQIFSQRPRDSLDGQQRLLHSIRHAKFQTDVQISSPDGKAWRSPVAVQLFLARWMLHLCCGGQRSYLLLGHDTQWDYAQHPIEFKP